METLFNPGSNDPNNELNGTNLSTDMLPERKHTWYIRVAAESIKAYLDTNPLKFKHTTELLEHLKTPGRCCMEHAFKSAYGYRIKEYMVIQRLLKSKELLQMGLPKKRVAQQCHYESQSAFTTAFRRTFGISPTTWEQACLGKNKGTR